MLFTAPFNPREPALVGPTAEGETQQQQQQQQQMPAAEAGGGGGGGCVESKVSAVGEE